MAQRTLELTLISAKDLKDVNLLSKMEVYAVVSLSGDRRSRQRIATDRAGGRNPAWNAAPLRFTVPASGAGSLHVLLRAERALGDRDVGEVHIPLSELLSGAPDGAVPAKFVSYQVRKISSGKPQGVLNFSYKIGEVTQSGSYPGASPPVAYGQAPPAPAYPPSAAAAAAYPPQSTYPPPTAYPTAAKADGSAAAAYPPQSAYPPPGKGNEPSTAYPPPAGYPPATGSSKPAKAVRLRVPGPAAAAAGGAYGYPPQAGYGGYQQQAVKPAKKNNFGMGLGAGLLGGALGGLLIGDAISDASAYDAGYDAGFDDGGGFDF
uniref:C2 domain-containing protein n=1 Tax=Oryza rufipogon TaxID=4529 RepID=A0A0E0N7A1_ORYRU